MPRYYEGARPHAWSCLSLLGMAGLAVGTAGYLDQLLVTANTFPSWDITYGKYLLAFSLFITIFLNTAYIWSADRHGRPLSLLSLILYPIIMAIGEGFLLLFLFDLGRWLRPLAAGEPLDWKDFRVGESALVEKGMQHPLFYNSFIWGFAPYTLAHAVFHAYVLEPLVLPDHLVLEAPNDFMKAIVVAQFSYLAIYYATGDVAAYCLLRWLGALLTVIAVRMPPPGARAAPKQKAKTN